MTGDPKPDAAPKRAILLAVPDDGLFRPIMESGFARAGWHTALVEPPAKLPEAVREHSVALVVLDMALPGAQEAIQALKLGVDTNWVPVVAIFPRGSDPRRPQELRVRADVELVEPIAVHHLIAAAETKAVRSSQPPSTRKVALIFPSRREELDRALDIATGILHTTGLEDTAQASLLAAVREAAANAIQHGNQGDPAKAVSLKFRQNPATVTFSIRDEGAGFDAQHYLRRAMNRDAAEAARDRHRAGGQGGLGILMLLRCTDQVRYNKAGNLVTLTRFLRKRA